MKVVLRQVIGIDCGALIRHPRLMDLTSPEPTPVPTPDLTPDLTPDPERRRRRLRLLAELAEVRVAREARWRSAMWRGVRVRVAQGERIRGLVAIRRRLAG